MWWSKHPRQGWGVEVHLLVLYQVLMSCCEICVQTHGSRVPWEDPSDWVIKTYPWTSQGSETAESPPPLLRLRPEDVGYDMQAAAAAAAAGVKAAPTSLQTETETTSDPLVRLLSFFIASLTIRNLSEKGLEF